jgi:hypothetical protein
MIETQNTLSMEFINRAQAIKSTGISYLGNVSNSSKIKKNAKVLNIDTYVLYLAPHTLSGYNTCPMATKDCISGCLNTSGRAGMEIKSGNSDYSQIIASRIKKTKLFYEQRSFFFDWLIAEIKAAKNLSEKKGNNFAVRLNGTSDINWNAYKHNGLTIFDHFSDIQFYDYTKVPNRFNNIPANYHLTLSYTGYNWNSCKDILNKGYNVAAVFNIQKWYNNRPENILPLPTSFKGFPVIDGDITDYRPYDKNGSIVALRFKRIADKNMAAKVIKSKFVIDAKDKDCIYSPVFETVKVK